METIFEHSACKSVYDAEKCRMVFTFTGYLNEEATKQMYLQSLAFIKENRTISFLNDLREIKGTFTNITSWIIETMQSVTNMGVRYDAMVLNDDVFTIFAANDLSKKISKLEFQLFKDMAEAENWLAEKNA